MWEIFAKLGGGWLVLGPCQHCRELYLQRKRGMYLLYRPCLPVSAFARNVNVSVEVGGQAGWGGDGEVGRGGVLV